MTSSGAPPTTTTYRPPPAAAPVDRVSFFAEQARNRRASWIFGLFVVVAIAVTGIPLGVLAGPLLYMLVMPLGLLMTTLQPHSAWGLLLVLPATIFPMLASTVLGTAHVSFTTPAGLHPVTGFPLVALGLALAVLPGALLFLIVWVVTRSVLRRAGDRAILATLGARDADPTDAEERLFGDVVEEMAVAAGTPTPRVAVIDSKTAGGAANCATVGWTANTVTVVVTRPLLDQLTRDQVQAMVARVVASIGNGDLSIAFRMLSMFQTARMIQFALFGVSRGRTLRVFWRCVQVAARRSAATSDDERSREQSVATDLIAVGSFRATLDQAIGRSSAMGCVFAPVLFPFRITAWTIGTIISISEYLLTGPLVDAAMRRRELLSDATAVRFTRNPDALAGALERLRTVNTILPQADKLASLFAVWIPAPTSADKRSPIVLFARKPHAKIERRLAQLVAMGAHPDPASRPAMTSADAFVASTGATFADATGSLIGAFLGLMLLQIAAAMTWVAVLVTSFELFALSFLGLWIVQRLAIGPH